MKCSWNIFGIILLLSSFRFQVVRAQALALVVNADNITYVPAGSALELNVSYTYSGTKTVIVQWNFNGSGIVGKSGNDPPQGSNSRATIRGKASLVLYNTILSDNGTYSVSVQPLGEAQKESSFQVIIEEKRNATTNCSQTSLNEGTDITCLCYSTSGNPPPTASWFKDGKMIGDVGYMKKELLLKNVTKEDSGTYVCQVRSHNLIDEKSVQVIVKYKPRIVSFRSDQKNNIAAVGVTIEVSCKADANPPANYIISVNGTQLTGVRDGVKTICTANYGDAGRYECLAKNSRGNLSSNFYLNVIADPWKPTTRPFETTEIQTLDESCSGQEWYISVITFICGICVGTISLYAIQRLQHRLRMRRDHPKFSQPCTTSETSRERPENFSTYEDLDLRRMPAENNYQSLSVNSRNPKNVEIDVKDESSYQELDEVRENNDNNYQALNR